MGGGATAGGSPGGGSVGGGDAGGSVAGGDAGGATGGGTGGALAGGSAGGSAGGEAGGTAGGGSAGGSQALTVSISSTVSITEGNGGTTTGMVQVTLSAAASQPVTVSYATADGNATAASDYTDTSGTLTFAPGTTTMSIAVDLTADTLDEDDETFFLGLSAPQGASLGTATATLTITDDDATPAISVAAASALESAPLGLGFVVTLSAPSGKPITVDYATANGTATGPDYTAATGTLTFAAQETTKTVAIALTNDALDEADETLTLGLSMATNATIATASTTGTITDDDPSPTITIDDVSVSEGNVGTSTLTFTVTLSAPSGQSVSVNYATTAATATAGSDYATATGTLTIPAGMTTGSIAVTITGDLMAEVDEAFTVTLSSPTNALIASASATGTILNDDGNLPSLSISDAIILEGNAGLTNLVFTVVLNMTSTNTVTVGYATANVTATDVPGVGGSDYVPTSGTLTFPPGSVARTFTVAIVGDVNDEANETFRVNLSMATNAIIGDPFGVGSISDDDVTPSLSVTPVAVSESAATATFIVSLSAPSGRPVSVNFATADSTATAGGTLSIGGQDYVARSGTLTFAPGETTKSVAISINADSVDEADEVFTLTLSAPVDAVLGVASVNGTITDDDATPTLSIGDLSKVEGTGGSSIAAVPVTLSAVSGRLVTVSASTGAGIAPQASAGVDYTATTGTLSFPPGITSQVVNVTITPDALDEAFETFAVNLGVASNATVADAQGIVTIVNDDSPLPNISINNAPNVTEAATNTTMTFTVTLGSVAATAVTVNWATVAAGTATAGADFTAASGLLTFAPGETSKTITITVLADLIDEPTETVFVNLSGNSPNSNLLDAQGQGNIVDDDPSPTLSVANVTLTEGDMGTAIATLTVTMTGITSQTVTVNFTTADGTASAGTALGQNDYEIASGVLTFPPGTTARTVPVTINGDTIFEPTETFAFNLSGVVNAALTTTSATVTITNDDSPPVLTILGGSTTEGGVGVLQLFPFRVTLSAIALAPVTVTFATANGTATAGSDYNTLNATVTVPAGALQVNRSVVILGDSAVEANETFTGNLSNANGATIGTASATCTIVNDD